MNPQLTEAGKFAPGNSLGSLRKPRVVFDGLVREVQQNPAKLKAALASILDKAADGDLAAMDWIACRLEGKPAQAVTVSGDEDRPLINLVKMVVVRADADANVIEHAPSVSIEHTATLEQIEPEQQLTVQIETEKISATGAGGTGTHPHPLSVIVGQATGVE